MRIGFSDSSKSQYTRIMELLLTYYPVQENEFDFKVSDAFERVMVEKENSISLQKWKEFLKGVRKKAKSGLRVSASQWLMSPSFKGIFSLKREKIGRAIYRREFVVYLSLIGNFYTMYGLDEVSVTDDKVGDIDSSEIWFEPVLYPHPYSVYKKWFLLFHQEMKEAYPDYKFVPYETLKHRPKDISTGDGNAEGEGPSIFQALFSFEDINKYRMKMDAQVHPFADRYGFE
jgi:hypothetical protein